jgi:hypothetical protein
VTINESECTGIQDWLAVHAANIQKNWTANTLIGNAKWAELKINWLLKLGCISGGIAVTNQKVNVLASWSGCSIGIKLQSEWPSLHKYG